MGKYQPLWEYLAAQPQRELQLTYGQIEEVLGFALDHGFLSAKKELPAYGWEFVKLSMKQQWVRFRRVPVPLATRRLYLRALTDGDAEDVFEACSNPVLGLRAGWPPHLTVEDSLAYIREIAPLGLVWGICQLGEDGAVGPVIGSIGLLPDPSRAPEEDALLLGYWLHQDYWNRGYMTEAALALLDWCRRTCPPRLFTTSHYVSNPASGRVIGKCGFTYTHTSTWPGEQNTTPEEPTAWYEMPGRAE